MKGCLPIKDKRIVPLLEQLEEGLVMADVGIETSDKIIDELNKAIDQFIR